MMRTLLRRARALFERQAIDHELGDEMRFHLRMETEDLVRTHGLSREEARRQARVRFGGVDRHTEAHRDARGVRWIADTVTDVKYALRGMRRTPTFAVSAILVLSLGIGASTAIFSAVNAVVVSHLPYPNDDQSIRVFEENSPTNRWPLSLADVRGIEQLQRTFAGFGAMVVREVPVSANAGEAARLRVTPGDALAVAGRRLLAASLYQAIAGDPAILGATTVVLLAVAAVACVVPALRAANVDAMAAIRADSA